MSRGGGGGGKNRSRVKKRKMDPQVKRAAKAAKIPKHKWPEFSREVEDDKSEVGRGGADNLSFDQLLDLARDFARWGW